MPNPKCIFRPNPTLDDLPDLVAFIETFGEEHDLGPGDVFPITLAVEELFANTLHHSQPPATLVEVTLQIEDNGVAVTYSDDGGAFDPTQQAAPDTTLSAEERAVGGLGIEIIRKTMQDLRYTRTDGRNCITFSRRGA